MVKVSIIITCYNLQQYIEEAIVSLLQQKCDFSFEIIVIDDASTDQSREVISRIGDPRIQFVPLPQNVGAAQAINIGFSRASGEYVCRFDGDDKWYPDYLQQAAGILDAFPDVVLVHTDVSFIDGAGKMLSNANNINRPANLQPADYEFVHILKQYYMNAPAIMARRTVWDAVLPWPERFRTGLGDWFLALSMVEGKKSYFINRPLAYYRIHTSNMHRAMIRDKSGEANTAWILDYFKNRHNGVTPGMWQSIYFEHYKRLGYAYFGQNMDKDAARCLRKAMRYNPKGLFDFELAKIWMASVIGKARYDKMKALISR
jgi:glycosyltransferase involved in cell wall biosynthesis